MRSRRAPADAPSLSIALLALIVGCDSTSIGAGEERGSQPALRDAASGVNDGAVDEDDTAVLGVVRATVSGDPEALCTGVLVLPNLVLTARHCVAVHEEAVECATATFGDTYDAERIRVSIDTILDPDLTDYIRAAAVFTLEDPRDCGFDQALVELAENIPAELATPLVPRIDRPTEVGEIFTAIGYGLSSPSANDSGTRRRRDDLVVSCVGAACEDAYIAETEWSSSIGHCAGDSGAPALDADGRVIGIVSRGLGACTRPILGQVASFRDFILEHAALAAEHGGYELPEWAGGSTDVGGGGAASATTTAVATGVGAGGDGSIQGQGGGGGSDDETSTDESSADAGGCRAAPHRGSLHGAGFLVAAIGAWLMRRRAVG